MMASIQDVWALHFGDSLPFRPSLRTLYPARWVRFYALPGGKRLPTESEEEATIVQRFSLIASTVLADAPSTLIVTYRNGYRGQHEPPSLSRLKPLIVAGWRQRLFDGGLYDEDFEDAEFAAVTLSSEQSGALNELWLDVAYGRTAPLLLISMHTGRIVSPYDGGVDVFLEDAMVARKFHGQFADWASPREDGL